MKKLGSRKIETSRLILRSTEEADLRTVFNILLIPEVNKYYLTCKMGKTFEEDYHWQMKKLARAKNSDVFQWSIIKKEDNKCIGQISILEKADYPIEIRDIGWFIDPSDQKNGYAYEAARSIINYMFDEVGIKAIETSSAICNSSSFRLMEKLGFKKRSEQLHKQKYTFVEDFIDCYSYGITKEEYLKKSS